MKKIKKKCFFFLFVIFILNFFLKKTRNYFVILSSDIDDTETFYYTFYLPLASLAWKKIGYSPIVFLVSSNFNDINYLSKKTIDFLDEIGVQTVKIKSIDGYQKLTSKLSRIFSGFVNDKIINENDYIITSDADLIPINKAYYQVNDIEKITVWNSDCCKSFDVEGNSIKMYPLSHIGMTKSNWIKVTNLNESLRLNLKSLDSTLVLNKLVGIFHDINLIRDNKLAKETGSWFSDQKMISLMIHNYTKFNNLKINEIKYNGFRLDRDNEWHKKSLAQNFDKFTDFHLFHEELPKKWSELELFFEIFAKDSSIKKYISDYRKIFIEFF